MLHALPEPVAAPLRNAAGGVLSAWSGQHVLSVLAPCRFTGREVELLLPRWVDLGSLLEGGAPATLLIPAEPVPDGGWVEVRGVCRPSERLGDWPNLPRYAIPPPELYQPFTMSPTRIERVSGPAGYGSRLTFDLQ